MSCCEPNISRLQQFLFTFEFTQKCSFKIIWKYLLLANSAKHNSPHIFIWGSAASAKVMFNLRAFNNFLHSKTKLLCHFSIKFYLRISFYDINMDFGIFGSKNSPRATNSTSKCELYSLKSSTSTQLERF